MKNYVMTFESFLSNIKPESSIDEIKKLKDNVVNALQYLGDNWHKFDTSKYIVSVNEFLDELENDIETNSIDVDKAAYYKAELKEHIRKLDIICDNCEK